MKLVGKSLIIAGALFLTGFIFIGVGIGFLASGTKDNNGIENDKAEYEKITFVTDAASVNKIVANLESEDIKIVPGDGEAIKLTYYDIPEDEIYSVTDDNGKLVIKKKREEGINVNKLFFSVTDFQKLQNSINKNTDIREFILEVPKKYGKYTIACISGSIYIKDIEALGECIFDVTSGNVNIDNAVFTDNLKITSTSGSVSIDNCDIDGLLSVCSTSGGAKLNNVIVKDNLEINATSGDYYMDKISVGFMLCNTTSGDICANELAVEEGIEGYSTSGEYYLNINDISAKYSVEIYTTSGNKNIDNTDRKNSLKKLNINTTSGDVKVLFSDN